MLEYHAHLLAVQVNVNFFPVLVLLFGYVHSVKKYAAGSRLLQQIQGAEERGLAGAGGADDHHHISPVYVHAHAVKSLDGALVVVLPKVFDLYQFTACRHDSSSFQNGL